MDLTLSVLALFLLLFHLGGSFSHGRDIHVCLFTFVA